MSAPQFTTPLKRCTKCGNEFPATAEYFYSHKGKLASSCKPCFRHTQDEYRAAHPDRVQATQRAWYDKHKDERSERAKQFRRDNPKPKKAYIHPEVMTCTSCGVTFPATVEYFYANKGVKSGLTARCRQCVRADAQSWRDEHREQHLAASSRWYQEHKPRARENKRRWVHRNPEKVRASARRHYVTHADELRARKRQWARENHDKVLEQKRRWRANNPDLARAQWQRRYARKKAAEGHATADDLAAIRAAQTDKRGRLICWRCGKPIKGTPHLDHWIPLKQGGTHNPGNLRYMHARCNQSKGGKHPAELGRLL